MINGGMCGIYTLGDGLRGTDKCVCVITGRGMNKMVVICIWRVGKFSAVTVECGVVAILKISPRFWSAFCWSTPNCVIVEAGCGWSSATVSSCAAHVTVLCGDNLGRR